MADIAQGGENAGPGPGNPLVQVGQDLADLCTPGLFAKGTGGSDRRQSQFTGELADILLVQVGQGPDQGKGAGKEILAGDHGADIPRKTDIEKKGLDDVVAVVPQGELVEIAATGIIEELLATVAGAGEADIPVWRARLVGTRIRLPGGRNNVQWDSQAGQLALHGPGRSPRTFCDRLHVDMQGLDTVIDGCLSAPEEEQPGQHQGINSARYGDQDTVAVSQHPVSVQCLADASVDLPGQRTFHRHNNKGAARPLLRLRFSLNRRGLYRAPEIGAVAKLCPNPLQHEPLGGHPAEAPGFGLF